MKSVPVEKPDWLKKESVLQAGMEGALLQRIQMAVWEYMDQEVGERDGIKLAESIVEDVKKTCLSKAIQAAVEEERASRRVRVGMLRQWLNEDRITDTSKMVTNEDIEYWLSIIHKP